MKKGHPKEGAMKTETIIPRKAMKAERLKVGVFDDIWCDLCADFVGQDFDIDRHWRLLCQGCWNRVHDRQVRENGEVETSVSHVESLVEA
jgi:hypothetical protein